MKICIFGAGAIGGLLGVKLAAAGADVTVIARGPHLAGDAATTASAAVGGADAYGAARCTDGPRRRGRAGFRDRHVEGAFRCPPSAPQIATMMGPETALVTAVNGVPYWYFYKLDGPWRDRALRSVDPGGRPLESTSVPAGHRLRRLSGGRGRRARNRSSTLRRPVSARASPTAAAARASSASAAPDDHGRVAGAGARRASATRSGSNCGAIVAFNPISALTGATLERIAGDAGTRALVRRP